MQQWLGVTNGLKDAAAAIRSAAKKSDAAGIWTSSMDGKSLDSRYKAASQQGNLLAMADKMDIQVDDARKQSIANDKSAFLALEREILQKLQTE